MGVIWVLASKIRTYREKLQNPPGIPPSHQPGGHQQEKISFLSIQYGVPGIIARPDPRFMAGGLF
jgi:hypothetical protein